MALRVRSTAKRTQGFPPIRKSRHKKQAGPTFIGQSVVDNQSGLFLVSKNRAHPVCMATPWLFSVQQSTTRNGSGMRKAVTPRRGWGQHHTPLLHSTNLINLVLCNCVGSGVCCWWPRSISQGAKCCGKNSTCHQLPFLRRRCREHNDALPVMWIGLFYSPGQASPADTQAGWHS